MGKTCWSFQFAQHLAKFDSTVTERVLAGHHPLQLEHLRISCPRYLNAHHRKD